MNFLANSTRGGRRFFLLELEKLEILRVIPRVETRQGGEAQNFMREMKLNNLK